MDDERARLDGRARSRRRRARALSWAAAATVVVAVALVAVEWATSSDTAKVDSPSSNTGSTAARAHVLVTFDDHGVHASPSSAPAGIIEFGFADHRTDPSGSETLLYYEVQPNLGGDLITGVGGQVRVLLCPHQWFLVVRVDGAVKGRIPFDVSGTSPDCTTPIT